MTTLDPKPAARAASATESTNSRTARNGDDREGGLPQVTLLHPEEPNVVQQNVRRESETFAGAARQNLEFAAGKQTGLVAAPLISDVAVEQARQEAGRLNRCIVVNGVCRQTPGFRRR